MSFITNSAVLETYCFSCRLARGVGAASPFCGVVSWRPSEIADFQFCRDGPHAYVSIVPSHRGHRFGR